MDITEPRVDVAELNLEQGWFLRDGILFTGVAFERWPDGTLRWEVPCFEGYRSGIERHWYPSGQLESEREMIAGTAHGTAREWAEDGRLIAEAVYERGTLVRRERREGA